MRKGKKFLSVLPAVFICFTCLNFAANFSAVSAFAAEPEKTFDGEYDLDEYAIDLIRTDNNEEVRVALEKKLLSATGKSSPELITFKDLNKITTLNLSGLKLTELPECINYMTNLRTLNVSDNLLQNGGLSGLNLIGCTKLTNIDLSKNYLNRVPSWFIHSRVTTRNISNNFIAGENPRSIKVLTDEYYYVNGEELDEGSLKTRILDSVRFNDNSKLPVFLYDYDNPPYENNDSYDDSHPYPYELDFAAWDLNKYIDKDGKTTVDKDTFIDVTVCLFKDTESANTKATVRVYLLDGKSASSIRQRLTQLIDDCKKLNKADYTEASYNRLTVALQTAEALSAYTEADMEMLSSALSMLTRANNSLEKAASTQKATLDALVKVGGTYKEADYTPASWASFKTALDNLKAVQADKNATASEAQRAIKAFQKAQSGLASSALKIPGTAPKSDFEYIYGEDRTQTYSGTTLDGRSYTWTFKGTDITVPVDFKPEVQNTNSLSTDIMMEVGSASRFRLFSTAQTGAFPGKGTLNIELESFADGNYYLYKWDTAAKGGKMQGTAAVKDNKLTVSLEEGGVYYISPNVRNFDLKSTRFKINTANKQVVVPLLGSYSVNQLKNSMEFGSYVEVSDENGDLVSNVSVLYDGMTVNAPGGDKYKVKKSGDMNNDGKYTISDITALLTAVVNNTAADLGDINGDGSVNMTDVTDLLRYYINQ